MKNFGIDQVGTQIPKFQQPWRTLQVNRYDSFDRFKDEKIMPMVKKIAHYINEHGNSYNDLKFNKNIHSYAAGRIWKYKPQDRLSDNYSEHIRKYVEQKRREFEAGPKKSSMTNAQFAAQSSLIGQPMSFFGPVGTLGATIFGIPDLIYDWAASIDEPENLRNHAHTATNYAEQLAKIVPGKWDDYVAKAGNFVSNMDDAFSAFGQDMYNLNSNEE